MTAENSRFVAVRIRTGSSAPLCKPKSVIYRANPTSDFLSVVQFAWHCVRQDSDAKAQTENGG